MTAGQPADWGDGSWDIDFWQSSTVGLQLGVHRFRLLVRWYDQEDLFPTYRTWLHKEPSYASTEGTYSDYQDLLDNVGGGVELDVDLTCDLAGATTSAGRQSITEAVRASELAFTLLDKAGRHDPRRLPVLHRSRIGARLRLEVRPFDEGPWVQIATTWVESWRKTLDPENEPQVDVQSSDAMNMLARVTPDPMGSPAGLHESTGTRIERCLDDVPWNDKWGPTNIHAGTHACNHIRWDGQLKVLDHMRDVATVEDGLLYFEPDGTLRFEPEGWRSTRTNVLGVDLIPGEDELGWSIEPDSVVCPMELDCDDNDLNIINKAIVWRSTEYDTPVGDPPAQPDVVKRTASDSDSISWYGESAITLADLPCNNNTRTQQLADLWVSRHKDGAQDIGEFTLDLVKRPQDAAAVLGLRWGDTVIVRDIVGGTFVESVHEAVGVRHSITPYRWEATIVLDRKVT